MKPRRMEAGRQAAWHEAIKDDLKRHAKTDAKTSQEKPGQDKPGRREDMTKPSPAQCQKTAAADPETIQPKPNQKHRRRSPTTPAPHDIRNDKTD